MLDSNHGRQDKDKQPKPRKVSAKCWLAANFPLKVQHLLPLMDLMSHANKHFAKVPPSLHPRPLPAGVGDEPPPPPDAVSGARLHLASVRSGPRSSSNRLHTTASLATAVGCEIISGAPASEPSCCGCSSWQRVATTASLAPLHNHSLLS